MHHTAMVTGEGVHLNVARVDVPAYTLFEYKFTSIQIIPTGGRAPPFFNLSFNKLISIS